ncbi:MAG: hypothetical protein QM739_04930 [Propionivibrio sp.]
MQSPVTSAEVPVITPFWQRIPRFFRYPLHIEPLFYMAVLALATLLGFILPLPSPLDHLIVHLGVWLAFIRYAYKTLDQTSQGLLTPEQHRFYDARERANLPYKQFAIFLVSGFAISLAGLLGNVAVGLMMIFFVLAMPASIMILSITQSFWAGLNPFAAVGMMRVIGLPYLGLCAFLFLLSSSQGVLQMELVPRVPEWLMVPTLNFVAMYFTLIMFNMMGYVVYQYHALLGVEISAAAPDGAPAESAVDAIGQLIAAGQLDEAIELAYEAQRVAPGDVAAHGRYHKLLLLAGREERAVAHARTYLTLLLQKGSGEQALDLYREMLARESSFAPEQPAQLLRLAEAARRRREYTPALALIKGFDKRFPRHPEIPAVYLFAASVLCENLRQDASARQILGVLLARYPEHPVAGEARQLATVIDKLAAPASA